MLDNIKYVLELRRNLISMGTLEKGLYHEDAVKQDQVTRKTLTSRKRLGEFQTGWKIKTVNVLDYYHQYSTQQCIQSRVGGHLGVARIHQKNRLVEEKNVTVFAKVCCFLIQLGLSKVSHPQNGSQRNRKNSELSPMNAIQADCDVKTTNIILQGLPPQVYALVSNHKVAKDLWERIQLLMQETLLTKQERECKLYDEFDKFAYKKGETQCDFYLKFSLLLNDMNIYKVKLEQFQVYKKSLNNLPPEWSKFVTDVKLVLDLHTTSIDQLYAYLEKHEFHANEVRLTHERNSDPFALVATHQLTHDSVGNSGGILCTWDPNCLCKRSSTVSDYFVIIRGVWLKTNIDVLLVVVYAPHDRREKRMLWDYLSMVVNNWEGEVIMMGGFNEVRLQSDRFGSVFHARDVEVFNSFILNAGLAEVPLGGSAYTWWHKSAKKMSKLDRFLISEIMWNSYPNISAITLDRYLSDHRPILL
nr:RNA-directed DNA polymerase, eukaryota [Tanacetum cinerariifolium]